MGYFIWMCLLGIIIGMITPHKNISWWEFSILGLLAYSGYELTIVKYVRKINQISDDMFDLKRDMGLIDDEGSIDRELTTKYQKDYYLNNKVYWHIYWDFISKTDLEKSLKDNYKFTERQKAKAFAREIFRKRGNEVSEIRKSIEENERSTKEILKELRDEWKNAENQNGISKGELNRIRRDYKWKYAVTRKISRELKDGEVFDKDWSPRNYYLFDLLQG